MRCLLADVSREVVREAGVAVHKPAAERDVDPCAGIEATVPMHGKFRRNYIVPIPGFGSVQRDHAVWAALVDPSFQMDITGYPCPGQLQTCFLSSAAVFLSSSPKIFRTEYSLQLSKLPSKLRNCLCPSAWQHRLAEGSAKTLIPVRDPIGQLRHQIVTTICSRRPLNASFIPRHVFTGQWMGF